LLLLRLRPVAPVGPVAPVTLVPDVPLVPEVAADSFVPTLPKPSITSTVVSSIAERLVNCKFVKLASDPLTINFFQFGMFMFYYGWLLKEPTSVMAYNIVINMGNLFIIKGFLIEVLKF
jgi:hypothetical protein